MRSSRSEAAAREPSFPRKQDTFPDLPRRIIRKTWRIWSGACFAVVLLAVFAQRLLAQINLADWTHVRQWTNLALLARVARLSRYSWHGAVHVFQEFA